MDQQQQARKRPLQYECKECNYRTTKKQHYVKHTESSCEWPRNTQRRNSEMPGFELPDHDAPAVADVQRAQHHGSMKYADSAD
jgi:hypothetical protein